MLDPRSWNSTAAEPAADYACAKYLSQPCRRFYRAIDVDAPPQVVFRWLCQLKVASYSYDWPAKPAGRPRRRRGMAGPRRAVRPHWPVVVVMGHFSRRRSRPTDRSRLVDQWWTRARRRAMDDRESAGGRARLVADGGGLEKRPPGLPALAAVVVLTWLLWPLTCLNGPRLRLTAVRLNPAGSSDSRLSADHTRTRFATSAVRARGPPATRCISS
jgi:hypothetical protein